MVQPVAPRVDGAGKITLMQLEALLFGQAGLLDKATTARMRMLLN